MIANIPRRTFRARTPRTMMIPNPTLLPSIIHPHTTPIIISHILASSLVRRSIRPSSPDTWTLVRRLSRKPISITKSRIAIGIGKAFHTIFESGAFFAAAGGAVLSFLTVGIVPFVAAEEAIFGAVGPDCGVDLLEGCCAE